MGEVFRLIRQIVGFAPWREMRDRKGN